MVRRGGFRNRNYVVYPHKMERSTRMTRYQINLRLCYIPFLAGFSRLLKKAFKISWTPACAGVTIYLIIFRKKISLDPRLRGGDI